MKPSPSCVDCGAGLTSPPRGRPPKRCLHHTREVRRIRDRARKRNLGDDDRERYRAYYARNREVILEKHRSKFYPENRAARIAQAKRYVSAAQEATSARAVMSGQPWSAAEDALIRRSQLRTVELALALGRTYKAVAGRRHLLRGGSEALR